MKEISKFYVENKTQVNPIEKMDQSSCKGGRFSFGSFGSSFLAEKSITRVDKLKQPKIFSSLSELRVYFSGGK